MTPAAGVRAAVSCTDTFEIAAKYHCFMNSRVSLAESFGSGSVML